MPKIALSGKRGEGLFTIVDEDDYEKYKDVRFYYSEGYAYCGVVIGNKPYRRKTTTLHRLIMNAQPSQQVDHINRNRLDNRKENLRFSNQQQNQWNRSTNKRYKNIVRKSNSTWVAVIEIDRNIVYQQSFDSEIDAAHAADWAMLKYHGEFANLNFKDFDYTNYIPRPKRYNLTSSYDGIYYRRDVNRWCAQINVNTKRKSLGRFATEDDAVMYRDLYILKNGIDRPLGKPDYPYTLDMEVKRLSDNTTSIYYGVIRVKGGKYYASVTIKGKSIHLGAFADPLEAALVREKYIKDNKLTCKLNFDEKGERV